MNMSVSTTMLRRVLGGALFAMLAVSFLPADVDGQYFGRNKVQFDDFDFQIGLQITLPIYSGGERYADLRQSRAEIRRLAHQRRSVELRVEQGVRSTMAQIAPAYANIELSRRAADAAERNLELVNAAYLAGSVDILRVLDAQTQALTARLSAANAIYDLMITILQAERRSGRFNYFTGPEDRVEFLDRLHEFEGRHRLSQPTRTPAAQEVE